jgi:hypothetical protein
MSIQTATIQCPKCEDGELEWEWFSGSWDEPPDSSFSQTCECDFTDEELEPLEVKAADDANNQAAAEAEDEARYIAERLCPICYCDKSEHNWEVHTAELRNG